MVARRTIRSPYGAPVEPAPDVARELRSKLRGLREAAQKNEVILRKTQERELELLSAESLCDLLRVLVGGLADSYGLDVVTLVLVDPDHEVRHLIIADGERLEDFPDALFIDNLTDLGGALRTLVKPWVGPYAFDAHGMLFPRHAPPRSVALIPLLRRKRLGGVLAFGSADVRRFTRAHSTDFLAHLGIIAAVCLENAVNRARLLRSGLTDFLTGWHNRRYLHTRMKEELARAQRHAASVACLMIDLDHFKQLNDTRGHLAGDQMLREMARRIESHTRTSDTAARFGGDEFALLLPETTLSEATRLAERILRAVTATAVNLGAGGSARLSLSIGVGALRPSREERDLGAAADRLLARADAALYKAKAEGRGRVIASEDG